MDFWVSARLALGEEAALWEGAGFSDMLWLTITGGAFF
jgi:hypothetical protein